MTDTIILVAFCIVILAAIILCIALAYWWHNAYSDSLAATAAMNTASNNLLEAERQRDDEHAARVGAEATVGDLKQQLTQTEAALNSFTEAHAHEIHDAIAAGDPAAAVAVIHRVFASGYLSATPNASAGHDGATAAAVQPASLTVSANLADPSALTRR